MKSGKILKRIPLCEPEIRGNEWKYIKECLDTNWVSSVGKYVEKFEHCLADYIGVKHAVACMNGTAALHMALLAAGLRPDEEVLVPALTFIAPANAVRYIGAWPVFIDVDPQTWQMDSRRVVEFLKENCDYRRNRLINRATKRTVKMILPVHILGHPVDMDPIVGIAKRYHLKVIEDVAESIGATYKGRMAGSLGDIGCFSFNGNKIITTGGGGMVVTNDRHIADRVRYLTTQAKDDVVEYIHREIGYNYRLGNIQAAMGVAQMERLKEYIAIKNQIRKRYEEGLRNVEGIALPANASWARSICWLYTILIDGRRYGRSSRELMRRLKKEGIDTRPFWHPLHSLKIFKKCYAHKIRIADQLYWQGLSLPSSVGLAAHEQRRVIQVIRDGGR